MSQQKPTRAQNTRRLLAAGAAASVLLTVTGCSGAAGGVGEVAKDCTPAYEGMEPINKGTLTVATYDFPPLATVDGIDMSGVEGDLLKEVAERQCLTLTVESSGGANASIPSVDTGRADLAAGDWYRTKERGEIVRLSAPIYLDQNSVISTSGLKVDELEGQRVGSIVGNLWNSSVQSWLKDDFVVYQDDESLYGDLEAGRIDAIITGTAPAQQRLKDNPVKGATLEEVTAIPEVPEFEKPGQVGWPTRLDNEEFGETLDKLIADLHEDGTISDVLEKWELDPSAADVGDPYEL